MALDGKIMEKIVHHRDRTFQSYFDVVLYNDNFALFSYSKFYTIAAGASQYITDKLELGSTPDAVRISDRITIFAPIESYIRDYNVPSSQSERDFVSNFLLISTPTWAYLFAMT